MLTTKHLIITELVMAALLLGCIAPMPYGYFILVRLGATVGFLFLAWIYNLLKERQRTFIALVLAALFQPFAPLPLGRALWLAIDIVIALALIGETLRLRKYH